MSRVAVVIPCYKVSAQIAGVIRNIGPEVTDIFVVDDACPENSSKAAKAVGDPRVICLSHNENQGVGSAVITGYKAALAAGAQVIVKLDGDGQMNPGLISRFIQPILAGKADYTKGNRFYYPEDVQSMPITRLFGNLALSFMAKISSGYWNIFDSTNGYTAIDARVLAVLPFEKIAKRYFFESDMLFRLYNAQAVVQDIPMAAIYQGEPSSLTPHNMILPFIKGHARNFFKRLLYQYYLRNFSLGSLALVFGLVLFGFGTTVGAVHWWKSIATGNPASAGTIMLSALPVILGFQLLLTFLHYDISAVPAMPISDRLA